MNLKENLKRIRRKNKLTQEELAELIDIKVSTVRYYEQGIGHLSFHVLEKLKNALKCSYDDLLE